MHFYASCLCILIWNEIKFDLYFIEGTLYRHTIQFAMRGKDLEEKVRTC